MTGVLLMTTLLVLAIVSSACTTGPSSFFRNFSLRDVVVSNKNQIHADCEPPNGGGAIGGGGGWSGFGSLGKRAHYSFSKSMDLTCKLDPNGFNEAVAMPLLQRVIEQSISESGAKVTGRENPERASFTLTYAVNGAEGKLTVTGKEVLARQYSFQIKVEESRKESAAN